MIELKGLCKSFEGKKAIKKIKPTVIATFLKWEENGCDCDAGEIARTLEELYS